MAWVVLTHYLRFMPYLLRTNKTHGVQVIAVYFTTETIRRILNMTSGVKFEQNLSYFKHAMGYTTVESGFDFRQEQEVYPSATVYRLVLGPIRPPPQGTWVSKPACKSAGAWNRPLTDLYLVPKLRMRGAILLLSRESSRYEASFQLHRFQLFVKMLLITSSVRLPLPSTSYIFQRITNTNMQTNTMHIMYGSVQWVTCTEYVNSFSTTDLYPEWTK